MLNQFIDDGQYYIFMKLELFGFLCVLLWCLYRTYNYENLLKFMSLRVHEQLFQLLFIRFKGKSFEKVLELYKKLHNKRLFKFYNRQMEDYYNKMQKDL